MKNNSIYGLALIFAAFCAFSTALFHHTGKAAAAETPASPFSFHPDSLSGEWEAFVEAPGTRITAKINFHLNGDKISGTFETEHTGPGTISKGSWKNNKLNFTADFAKHESISFTAELLNDKLAGEYTTEGRTGKWEAKKK